MAEDETAGRSCSMVGFLGIMIQLALGVLSFSVLIVKRIRQQPQRPWKIWIFDTSKQLVSQMMAHFMNLTISIALAYQDSSSDECLWYFTTNVLDNTLGVIICVLCLKGIERSLTQRRKYQYISGNYYKKEKIIINIEITNLGTGVNDSTRNQENGKDEKTTFANTPRTTIKNQLNQQIDEQDQKDSRVDRLQVNQTTCIQGASQSNYQYHINYKAWVVQLLIWISVVVIGKSVLFGTEIGLQNPLKNFTFLIMGWIQAIPLLQLMVVIVIVPVVMNGLAFWVQDNFLMKKTNQMSEGESPLIGQECPPKQQLIDIV